MSFQAHTQPRINGVRLVRIGAYVAVHIFVDDSESGGALRWRQALWKPFNQLEVVECDTDIYEATDEMPIVEIPEK